MEIREVIKLKEGVGGLRFPFNYAILLDRIKAKRSPLVKIHTIHGNLTIKSKLISEGTGRIYHGDKTSGAQMTSFLNDFIKTQKKRNLLRKEPSQIINENTPEDIWRAAVSNPDILRKLPKDISEIPGYLMNSSIGVEEAGKLLYPENTLAPNHLKAIQKILSSSIPRSKPFFEIKEVDGEKRYIPYDTKSVKEIEDHIHRLNEMKSYFVEWVEDEEGGIKGKGPKLIRDRIYEVDLPGRLEDEMDRVVGWAMFYLENGRMPTRKEDGPVTCFGLANTPVTNYRKFSLESFISYLALDITGSKRMDLPSNLLSMLLKLNRITWRKASELVISYHMSTGASRFRDRFPDHVISVADRIPDAISEVDEKGRLDLTHLETYTIDPSDAKDFDDAISLEKEEGNHIVWVHIADVSHYVLPNGPIDTEAKFRSTSVYLPTGVIPMLPPKLSEVVCSLKEDVKRLTLSTRMEVDPHGEIIKWEHMPSVIMVDRNLTYRNVEDFIDEKREPFSSLWNIAKTLEGRYDRLNMETPERKIKFTSDNSIDLNIKRPTRATRLIEQLMVITNECSARFIREKGASIPYRVHPIPDKASVGGFNAACEALEVDISIDPGWNGQDDDNRTSIPNIESSMLDALKSGDRISLGEMAENSVDNNQEEGKEGVPSLKPIDAKEMKEALCSFNKALEDISGIDDQEAGDILRMNMLRTMPRAFYSVNNLGHFGLGSMCYCHFTSPIRRYPDIIVHRTLKKILAQEGDHEEVVWDLPDPDELDLLVEGINEMTQMADDWERQMIDVALATRALMDENFSGRTHKCRIVSLSHGSCFLSMDDGATEGRIPVSQLSHHSLDVDETQTRILLSLEDNPDYIQENKDDINSKQLEEGQVVIYSLGDRVKCGIYDVSLAWGRIELFRSS